MTDVMERIYERAREVHARIILAEPYDPVTGKDDERVTQAAAAIRSEGLAQDIILLTPGYWASLEADVQTQLVETLQTARAGREDINDATARTRLSSDTKQLAATMVKAGLADGYVAGNICATADTIRPALQIIGTENGFASSFFPNEKWICHTAEADTMKPRSERPMNITIFCPSGNSRHRIAGANNMKIRPTTFVVMMSPKTTPKSVARIPNFHRSF
jgi:hypothetical protein